MSASARKVRQKRRPGEIRDALIAVLESKAEGATISEIEEGVELRIGFIAPSSVRSYLRLNTPSLFERSSRGYYSLRNPSTKSSLGEQMPAVSSTAFSNRDCDYWPSHRFGNAQIVNANCFDWLLGRRSNSIHAVVTDPPYGLIEYTAEQQTKLRNKKGGVWRIPPAFDGSTRSPLPRFTILSERDLAALGEFFFEWGRSLIRVLVPGANVVVASNPLLSYIVSGALARCGLERRGEIVRLVMTMRGGDRPKAAHEEFASVSVMPRSMWEPWLLFRKPIEGRVQDNLRKWKTGGFRRPCATQPFGDVIRSAPTHQSERALAPHPSLKPQTFLRTLVRGALPLGEGVVFDPFAGSGSTLAAAEALGYESIGLEKDPAYYEMALKSIPSLVSFKAGDNYSFDL